MSADLNGTTPESDRHGAPAYLARYRDRERTGDATSVEDDTGQPLYLRQFRARQNDGPAPDQPLWQRGSLAQQQALTEDNRNKEISAPQGFARALRNDVFLIRHGETQGYSTDSGLTPQGVWQAHSWGQTLARRIKSGETVVFRHAATARATETAQHIHRGFVDGLAQYEKDITIEPPAVADEFRNFGFVAPDGLKDVTAAFREYSALLEGFERSAARDRPQWVVEMGPRRPAGEQAPGPARLA